MNTIKIIYPDKFCSNGTGHHFVNLVGNIWWCKNCWAAKWQPMTVGEAFQFSSLVARKGIDFAYKVILDHNQDKRKLLVRLEEIRLVRKSSPDKEAGLLKYLDYLISTPEDNNRRINLCQMEMEISFSVLMEET